MKISNLKKDSDYSVLRQWCVTICDYLLSIDPRCSITKMAKMQELKPVFKSTPTQFQTTIYANVEEEDVTERMMNGC